MSARCSCNPSVKMLHGLWLLMPGYTAHGMTG